MATKEDHQPLVAAAAPPPSSTVPDTPPKETQVFAPIRTVQDVDVRKSPNRDAVYIAKIPQGVILQPITRVSIGGATWAQIPVGTSSGVQLEAWTLVHSEEGEVFWEEMPHLHDVQQPPLVKASDETHKPTGPIEQMTMTGPEQTAEDPNECDAASGGFGFCMGFCFGLLGFLCALCMEAGKAQRSYLIGAAIGLAVVVVFFAVSFLFR